MEDVHEKAWSKNKDTDRIKAILGDNSPTADKQTNKW
jgi:hypothetical protein